MFRNKKFWFLAIIILAILSLLLGIIKYKSIIKIWPFTSKAAAPVINPNPLPAATDTQSYFAPIFTFHHIAKAPAGSSQADISLYIEPIELENLLKDLAKNNYQTVFASTMGSYLAKDQKAPKNLVAITFDDGYENFYTNAFPLLKKYQAKASLYIMTSVKGKNFLTPDQIKEIDQSGLVEVGSHTVFHIDLAKASEADAQKELINSKKFLDNLLGKPTLTIAYPFGAYNDQVEKLVREAGYTYGFSYNHNPLKDTNDVFAIDRTGFWPGMNAIKFMEKTH